MWSVKSSEESAKMSLPVWWYLCWHALISYRIWTSKNKDLLNFTVRTLEL